MDMHSITCHRGARWGTVLFLLVSAAFAPRAHAQTPNQAAWCPSVEPKLEIQDCVGGPFGGCETQECRSAIRDFYKAGSVDLHNKALKACSVGPECPAEKIELESTVQQWSAYLESSDGRCPDLTKFQSFRVPDETACQSSSTSLIRSNLTRLRCTAFVRKLRCREGCPPVANRCALSRTEAEKVKNRHFAFCPYPSSDKNERALSLFVCPRFAAAEDEADCGASVLAARDRMNNPLCKTLKLQFDAQERRWELGSTRDLQVTVTSGDIVDDNCLFVSSLDGTGCSSDSETTLFSPLMAAERGQTSIDNADKMVSRILFFGCEKADKECKRVVGWSAERRQGAEAFTVTPFTGPAGDLVFPQAGAGDEDVIRRAEEFMQLRRILLASHQTAAFGPPPALDRDTMQDCAWLGESVENPVLCWAYSRNARAPNFRTWRPFAALAETRSLNGQQKDVLPEWTSLIREASEKLKGPAFVIAGSDPASQVIFTDGSAFVGWDGRGNVQAIDGPATSWLAAIMNKPAGDASSRLEWFRSRWPFQLASLAKDMAPACWVKRSEKKLDCGILGAAGAEWSPIDNGAPPDGFDRLLQVAGSSDYQLFSRIASARTGVRLRAFHKHEGQPAIALLQIQQPGANRVAWLSFQKDAELCTSVTVEGQLKSDNSSAAHYAADAQIAVHRAGAQAVSLYPADRDCMDNSPCKTIVVASMKNDSAVWMGSSSTNPEDGWRLASRLQKISRDFQWIDETNFKGPFLSCLTGDDTTGVCSPQGKDFRMLLLPREESKIIDIDLADVKWHDDVPKSFAPMQCPIPR
jgi:hypothetical protein